MWAQTACLFYIYLSLLRLIRSHTANCCTLTTTSVSFTPFLIYINTLQPLLTSIMLSRDTFIYCIQSMCTHMHCHESNYGSHLSLPLSHLQPQRDSNQLFFCLAAMSPERKHMHTWACTHTPPSRTHTCFEISKYTQTVWSNE